MSTLPIALIIGAGSRVGLSVARAFTAKGYQVLVSSRKPRSDAGGDLEKYKHFTADAAQPGSIVDLFENVRQSVGVPSVVIYNAASFTPVDGADPLSLSSKPLSVDALNRDFNVNTTSVLIAAQQAVQGFKDLPQSASRTFIFTGNILNVVPIPSMLDAGMGKAATAQLIMTSAATYGEKQGFKFYYADERKAEGGAAFQIDGDAHAQFYLQLAEDKKQSHWLQTFVKGKGYVDFSWQFKPKTS